MSQTSRVPDELQRVPSGIDGLDAIVGGGFFQGGVYILTGPPGAGKTILANQMAFSHGAGGGRVLYVTLLAESNARLFAHLRGMKFFDPDQVATSLHYVSGYQALESGGLTGLLSLLRKELRERRATLLVLDGLVAAESFAGSRLEMKKFVHELQALVSLLGATALLVTSANDPAFTAAEHTMVDGLIDLEYPFLGVRAVRELLVRKFRGSHHLPGRHTFDIDDDGITVYPRMEAVVAANPIGPAETGALMPMGVPGLDRLLGGGIGQDTSTLVLGPSGSGKTLMGLHFLQAGVARGERCLYFGFNESAQRLLSRARRSGVPLDDAVEQGLLKVVWQPSVEHLADGLAQKLLREVAEHRAQRVVVDTLKSIKESILVPDRTSRFLAALTNQLRVQGTTTLMLEETAQLFTPGIDVPVGGISAIVESIVFIRQVEVDSTLRRVLCVLKTREGPHDSTLHEFEISSHGLRVLAPLRGAESILSGMVHGRSATKRALPAKKKQAARKRR
jgi:circadian clock protein KaiC